MVSLLFRIDSSSPFTKGIPIIQLIFGRQFSYFLGRYTKGFSKLESNILLLFEGPD